MKQATGAQVRVTAAAAEVMESRGRKAFRFGDELYYAPVNADRGSYSFCFAMLATMVQGLVHVVGSSTVTL